MSSSPFLLALILSAISSEVLAAPTTTTVTPVPFAGVTTLTSVSVTFSESVTGVDVNDLFMNGDPGTGVTGSGVGPYVFSFPQPAGPTVSMEWAASTGITGGTGAFAGGSWRYGIGAPLVFQISPTPGTTRATLTNISVTFNQAVTGVTAADLGINGDVADAVTGSGPGPYLFTFLQPSPGLVTVSWDAEQTIAGIGSGEFVAPPLWTYNLTDTIAPTLGKLRTSVAGEEMDNVRPAAGSTVNTVTQAVVTFSEPVSNVDAADLLVNGVAATGVTGENAGPYVFSFPAPAAGAVNFTWAAGHDIQDAAANLFGGTGWNITSGVVGQIVITEFLAANAGTALTAGSDPDGLRDENWDLSPWVELYNAGSTTVDLLGWSLTNDIADPAQWIFPARTLAAGARLVVWVTGKDRKPASATGHLHTNFSLNVNGGTLALFPPDAPAATPVSAWIDYPQQRYDFSYGIDPVANAARYFSPPSITQGAYVLPTNALPNPTPPPVPTGLLNVASTLAGVVPDPSPTAGRGFFNQPFSVLLTCTDPTATIRYTLDGSPPLITSPAYTTALNVTGTTVLRMVAFAPNKVPSQTITHTYLFPSTVVNQPSPPYDHPTVTTDNSNPQPPAPGGSKLPVVWGINTTNAGPTNFSAANVLPGFPTGTGTAANNLGAGKIPADYGMDPKVYADPTKYDDTGAVNPTTGKTNLERINTALHTLPSLSLVMKSTDMFGTYPGDTITYAGTSATDPLYPTSSATVSWKIDKTKACSLELMQPDGATVFAIDAGIDLHGNASRDPFKNPKHGFTIRFKGKFGAGKLQANVFPDSPVKEWDKLVLRGDFGGSMLHQSGADTMGVNDSGAQRARGIRIREAFCKDSFRDMGRVASHHRFCNLFINGVCWGSYELMEDQAQDFAASYLGNNKDDYDVIEQHPDPILTTSATLKSGSWATWSSMKSLLGWSGGSATSDLVTPPTAATFLTTFTNQQYETLRTKLDLPWFQDYMIWEFFAGHLDWGTTATDAAPYMKNVYFFRPPNGTYKAMPWDMENLLWHQDEDRVTGSAPDAGGGVAIRVPAAIHPRTRNNAEYRLEFADRAWRHLVRTNGALTPAANLARFDKWINVVGPDAMCLESARWGDYRYKTHAYTTGTFNQVYTWNGAWYDNSTAVQYDGTWASGIMKFNSGRTLASQLGTYTTSMVNSWYDEIRRLKTVYFPVRTDRTLTHFRNNGLYPFLNAPELRLNATNVLLGDTTVPTGTLVKLVMPAAGTGSSLGDIYYTLDGTDPRPEYDLSGTPRTAATLYSTPVTINATTTVKARARATLAGFPQKSAVRAASIASVGTYTATTGASLRGQITAAPLVLDGVTLAVGDRVLLKNQSLAAGNGIYVVTTLGAGATGVWDRATDWDADGEAVGGTWVRVTNGTQHENSVWRISNTIPIVVGGASGTSVTLVAFSAWSALLDLNLSVGPALPAVVISEINYNPRGSQGGSALEFIELHNYGPRDVDLSNWYFEGVDFVIPFGTVLTPGNRTVIASNNNPTLFATRFPGVSVLGYFSGSLSNVGERVSLYNGAGTLISSVHYSPSVPWPTGANNGGYSLELVSPTGDLQNPGNWRSSTGFLGTPGQANSAASLPAASVYISEFLASNGGYSGTEIDFIELHNPGLTDVDIASWNLRVSRPGSEPDGELSFASAPVLPAGTRLLISCTPQTVPGLRLPFTLDATHGQISLESSFGRPVDAVRYGPQIIGSSFGRSSTSAAWLLGNPTPGLVNTTMPTAPLTDLRLNELLANPTAGNEDWLEITNVNSDDPIVLTGLLFEKNGEFTRINSVCAVQDENWVRLYCNTSAERGDAVLMQLPAAGATISLRDSDGISLDSITYGPQTTDVSIGRLPDARGAFTTLPYPSPGVENHAAFNQFILNEVLVVNRTGNVAPWAHRPSWIEIKNPLNGTLNLQFWQLRNAAGQTWKFPAQDLAAGALLNIWADAAYSQPTTELNCGLLLSQPDTLELLNPIGQIADRISWGTQVADLTIGRLSDNSWALLASPTKGAPNSTAAPLAAANGLRINEWLADITGTAPEFLELFNPAPSPVSTTGLWLGDEPSETGRRKWQAPNLSFIGPNGYGYYQTSSDYLANSGPPGFLPPPNATSAQRINFNLSIKGEYLRLSQNDPAVTPIDSVNYGLLGSGSGGRYPDGDSNIQGLTPTPGYSNVSIGTGPVIYDQPTSIVRTLGTSASFGITANSDRVSVQWQRNGTAIPSANTLQLTLPSVTLADDANYTCIVTSLTGTTTSQPAHLTVLYNLSTWAQSLSIGSGGSDDTDNDGLSNRLEFLMGTDPLSSSSPAVRDQFLKFSGVETSGPNLLLGMDIRLSSHAVYNSLLGDLSPDLLNWSSSAPTATQTLSTEPNGDKNMRLQFGVPSNQSRHFLKLRLLP